MQISDLLRIMRQLIDLQEKKKGEKKREPLVPVGKSNRYLRVLFGLKKKWGVARESNRGREAQISASYH